MSTLDVRLSPYVPSWWTPTLHQHAFLALADLEALYGGAAGGGKSDAILVGALQYADIPGYSALILRRSYTDLALPGAIMDRAKMWLSGTPGVRWSDTDKTFTFASGATLTFGYLQTSKDKFRYQSAEFDYIAFDEVSQFEEADYLYMFSRLRQAVDAIVPLRMRGASNPGSKWVKRRFVDRATRVGAFVQARIDDNPHIDQAAYHSVLQLMDEFDRRMLEDGDWDARHAGDYVYDDQAITCAVELGEQYDHLLEEGFEPAGGLVSLGIDWGENTASIVVWPLEGGGVYIPPSELLLKGSEPGESADRIIDSATSFGFPLDKARYDAAGVQSMRTFVKSTGVKGFPVAFGRHKHETIGYLRHLLERGLKGHTTRILAISPRNTILLDQLRALELKDPDAYDFKVVKTNDHLCDALVAGVAPIAARHRDVVSEKRLAASQRLAVAA